MSNQVDYPSCSGHFNIDHTWNQFHSLLCTQWSLCICVHTQIWIKKTQTNKSRPQKSHLEVEVDHLSHEGSCLFKNRLCSNIRINFDLNLVYKRQVETNIKCFLLEQTGWEHTICQSCLRFWKSLFIHKAQKTNFCIWCYSQ